MCPRHPPQRHMNNEGIASPALRRSQLATAMSKREIPATEAPYEPCNDLGPTCASYLTRPCSRHDRGNSSPSPPRPSSSAPPPRTSSPSPTLRLSSRTGTKRAGKSADPKKLQQQLAEADAKAKEEWEKNDPQFDELFVPEELSMEDLGFRFHDPYPETWVEETVEDACFRGSKENDLFMHRLQELENLREETVLWEIYKEEKAEASNSAKGISNRVLFGGKYNSRTQSAKVSAPQLYRAKSAVNRLRRTSSAGKNSLPNNGISTSDDGSDSVQTFRNSGYQLGISFVPGSLYPEVRPPPKSRTHSFGMKSNGDNNSRKFHSASVHTHTIDRKPPVPKSPPCEACHPRPAVSLRATCASPRGVATSCHALRSQYALKASECYDIVEIARTFEPPCKAHFVKAKAKAKAKAKLIDSDVDKALSKGLSPGKSYSSQRRISLTRLTPDENMTVRGISPRNIASPSGGRCKSAKKGAKRR